MAGRSTGGAIRGRAEQYFGCSDKLCCNKSTVLIYTVSCTMYGGPKPFWGP